MGSTIDKVIQPVCNSCSQRKIGTKLFSLPRGPTGDWIADGVSPRTIVTETPGMPSTVRKGLIMGDTSEWLSLRGSHFTIRVAEIPKASGALKIYQGEPPKPVLSAILLQPSQGPRRLMLSPLLQASSPSEEAAAARAASAAAFASCAPLGGREPCAELDICGKDGRPWGAIVFKGDGTYSLFRDKTTLALTFQEDRYTGRLLAFAEDEAVAAAQPCAESDDVEVGVKPDIDPILILVCVLGVLIFDLGPAVLPVPVL